MMLQSVHAKWKMRFILELTWRWGSALLFSILMICSIMEVGRKDQEPVSYFLKWFIFITNWTITMAVIQSWLAVRVVTKTFMDSNQDFDTIEALENDQSTWGKLSRISYTIALVFSLFTAVGYWVLVYRPIFEVDFVTLIGHPIVFLLMAVDALILGRPIKMKDVIYNATFLLSYKIFTVIYFVFGGLNRDQELKINSLVDWNNPLDTCTFFTLVAIVTVMLHFIFYGIHRMRSHIITKIWGPKKTITKISIIDIERDYLKQPLNGEFTKQKDLW